MGEMCFAGQTAPEITRSQAQAGVGSQLWGLDPEKECRG